VSVGFAGRDETGDMDKIVDHLFVFRGEGEVEDFPGNYSDWRIYEDSVEPIKEESSKEKVSWKEKQVKAGLTFNEQKEFQKIEREIKDLEAKKKEIEHIFATTELNHEEIDKKSSELQKIISDLESKEERWFELSLKME
jgi:ATP-binding cassette subfamily F protein uup